ncbi:MAG TPA: helix-turn-helix domain-containing protein [Ktedonobacterales bacterium]|nr:helix-turn-helix domain-containing protein [Ktedonobacterales bacterium]
MARHETQETTEDSGHQTDAVSLAAVEAEGLSCTRFQEAVEFIGRRWNGAIVYILLDGPCRFNELLARVPNISDRLLTERLRELEAAGMVTRDVQPGPPVRVVYALTAAGHALHDVIQGISGWARQWMPDPAE